MDIIRIKAGMKIFECLCHGGRFMSGMYERFVHLKPENGTFSDVIERLPERKSDV